MGRPLYIGRPPYSGTSTVLPIGGRHLAAEGNHAIRVYWLGGPAAVDGWNSDGDDKSTHANGTARWRP